MAFSGRGDSTKIFVELGYWEEPMTVCNLKVLE
jgi:hypothetical protein